MSKFKEQYIAVVPMDSLMFRDGKPFSGDTHFAKSVFPPFPSSFAGLLRTHFGKYVSWQENKMKELGLGFADDYGDFKITGAYLEKDGEFYFCVPADLAHEKNKDDVVAAALPIEKDNDIKSSFVLPKKLRYSPDINGLQPFSSGFISATDMEKYLKADIKDIKVVKQEDFVDKELRTSVKIGKNAAAEEGKLFTAELLRFRENVNFAVAFLGPEFADKEQFATFGGEKRGVKLSKREKITLPDVQVQDKIKLVLTSPAYFENMQTPDLQIEGLELLSAVSLGYENIGGWDLAKHSPKPMKKAVKAGSVYYYKATQSAIEILKNKDSVSDEQKEAGFGKFLIGGF
jgi:CRISPR-associated protein Cmr3